MSPVFSWLQERLRAPQQGRLEAIFIAPTAGAPMQPLEDAELALGAGIAGDRYATGSGHWRLVDATEVTLITAEALTRAARRGGPAFANGEHRRNLVVSGIPQDAYRQRELSIGEVTLAFHRLRPRCGYLDRVSGPGTGKALGRDAGIGLRVLTPGIIRIGDPVTLR